MQPSDILNSGTIHRQTVATGYTVYIYILHIIPATSSSLSPGLSPIQLQDETNIKPIKVMSNFQTTPIITYYDLLFMWGFFFSTLTHCSP